MRWGLLDDNELSRNVPDRLGPLPDDVEPVWLDPQAGHLDEFDILLAMRERTAFPAAVLRQLPRLRLLITTGRGNKAIDLDTATELGIAVAGAPGSGEGPTEQTWALILAVQRHLPYEDRTVRAGGWGTTIGTGLAGRTLGLLGFGTIARKVARVGRAFGMEVIAYSRNLGSDEPEAESVGFEELFQRADVLSIHVPGGPATRHLVGPAELALLRPSAILVNTARGSVVDEAALFEALHSGRLRGAGLDVFETEPLPAGHPLTTLEQVVLSPHRGYVTDVAFDAFYRNAAEVVRSFVDGRAINLVNPAVLANPALRWSNLA